MSVNRVWLGVLLCLNFFRVFCVLLLPSSPAAVVEGTMGLSACSANMLLRLDQEPSGSLLLLDMVVSVAVTTDAAPQDWY